MKLLWDQVGERLYETGVDHGVLYIPTAGVYSNGYAWNGLTTVTESPSGAEASPQYADNIKYLNLVSAEEFGGTIEAFTYPEEFGQCDGTANPTVGVSVGQQSRKSFGLSYRTRKGNDTDGTDHGYKLHLVYGALAAPSEKAYATINDSPEAITFSWEFTTTPVEVPGLKPSAVLTIDSTKVNPAKLALLEDILYGTDITAPRLPLPAEVFALFEAEVPAPVAPTISINAPDTVETEETTAAFQVAIAVTGTSPTLVWERKVDDGAYSAFTPTGGPTLFNVTVPGISEADDVTIKVTATNDAGTDSDEATVLIDYTGE